MCFRARNQGFCARDAVPDAPSARSEDAKSLAEALGKYKRAVEASVEGGLMELGLKGFAGALTNIATRDSVKARLRVRRYARVRGGLRCACACTCASCAATLRVSALTRRARCQARNMGGAPRPQPPPSCACVLIALSLVANYAPYRVSLDPFR
jgi:hypothetical protein